MKVLNIRVLNFRFVSDFDIRISDLVSNYDATKLMNIFGSIVRKAQ